MECIRRPGGVQSLDSSICRAVERQTASRSGSWLWHCRGARKFHRRGIMRTPATIAARLPSAWLILLAWVVGGVYSLFGAWSLSEIGAISPVRRLLHNCPARLRRLHQLSGGLDRLDFCLRRSRIHQLASRRISWRPRAHSRRSHNSARGIHHRSARVATVAWHSLGECFSERYQRNYLLRVYGADRRCICAPTLPLVDSYSNRCDARWDSALGCLGAGAPGGDRYLWAGMRRSILAMRL